MFPLQISGPNALQSLDQPSVSEETIRLIQATQKRAVTSQTGFTYYLLEAPAKAIVPIITPLRNAIPRKSGKGAPSVNWKAITSFDTNRTLGTTNEGAVPPAVNYNVVNMNNLMATIALSNAVTFPAQWRGRGLEGDVRSRRTAELLYQLMTREEYWLINASQKIIPPPAPLLATATTGGTVAAATYWVQVTAWSSNTLNPSSVESTPSLMAAASTSSPYGVITTTGSTSTITITLFTVPNARYYTVYVGSGSTPPANGAMWAQAGISTTNAPQPGFNAVVVLTSGGSATSAETPGPTLTLTITAPPATSGTNPPTTNSAQTSTDTAAGNAINIWDGLMSQALLNAGSGGTLGSIVTRPAASTGLFALSDIDNLLLQMYGQSAGDPDLLVCNPIDAARITNLLITQNQTRLVIDANSPSQPALTANYRVTHYLNKTTGKAIPLVEDRYCPVGCLLFVPLRMPFPVADVANALEIETNQEYIGIDFAVTALQWQFADVVENTLKVYFLGGLGMLWGCVPSA